MIDTKKTGKGLNFFNKSLQFVTFVEVKLTLT